MLPQKTARFYVPPLKFEYPKVMPHHSREMPILWLMSVAPPVMRFATPGAVHPLALLANAKPLGSRCPSFRPADGDWEKLPRSRRSYKNCCGGDWANECTSRKMSRTPKTFEANGGKTGSKPKWRPE